ncbi:hypothetical protein [Paenibacillus sp. NPDC058071]|uniref:hypothetical protein n=1 Tax=Paenibacillus sp. NPDC058071 TaxID=3346326 RepID=UPI0036DC488E
MFCPVCNGLQPFQENCSVCHEPMSDMGRSADWTGPYSPYEPLEQITLYSQSSNTTYYCKHVAYCAHCSLTVDVIVAEGRF